MTLVAMKQEIEGTLFDYANNYWNMPCAVWERLAVVADSHGVHLADFVARKMRYRIQDRSQNMLSLKKM